MADEIGQELVSDGTAGSGTDEVKFYSTTNASFEVSVDGATVTVSEIKTPIDADKNGGANAFADTDDVGKFAASFVLVVDTERSIPHYNNQVIPRFVTAHFHNF